MPQSPTTPPQPDDELTFDITITYRGTIPGHTYRDCSPVKALEILLYLESYTYAPVKLMKIATKTGVARASGLYFGKEVQIVIRRGK